MQFQAPWGRLLVGITVVVVVVVGVVVGVAFAHIPFASPNLRLLIGSLPLLIILGAVPFVIRGYSLEPGGSLIIHRLGWQTFIPLQDLTEAKVDPQAMRRSIRLFGNGGLFAFAGLFWNRRLGKYRAFVTDLNRTVVLRFTHSTIVISPADPERFVRTLTTMRPELSPAGRT